MNIHVGGGRNSGDGDLRFDKLLAFVIFFSWLSEVHAITVEWSLVSPYELSKSKSNWQTLQGAGDTANVDFSKGGQIAFVPAAGYGGYGGYGLFNRAYSPRQINLYMGNPKHGQDSSSEEHRHRKKHHEPEHHEHHPQHHEHHPQHHKSAKEELNDEHAEQAEISAGIAGELSKLSQFMKAQVGKHIEMRDRELSQGNEEAARKEQIIIDLYQDQIKYLDGIEKAQEAIMAGEVEMYYDKDGAGHKPGHHGHHGGHGNHHGGGDKHHDADHPTHHHQYDDDNDGGGHGEDDEAEDEEHGDGHDDDEDEEHGDGHDGGEDDEEHGDHGNHHEDEGHGHGEEDEFQDVGDKFEEDEQGEKHKLDKRSPFVSSFLPSLSGSDTAPPKTPDTATPYSDTPADVKANAGVSPDTSLSTTSTDVATPATPTVISPDENTNSGWFSWFGSNNTPVYSPYALLDFMSPADKSADNLMSLFNVFSDPSNSSYLSNASTLMRIVMFFMPGTGIVDQVYFTMALSKIMWEAASMYYEGYGNTEIAVVVLTELVEAAYLSRRDEDSIISQKILTPGNTVKIEGMDVPSFLKYVHNMKYPDLTESQETKLQKDLDNLMNITYPNISPELKTTFTAGLKDTMRFLALFNVQGDLQVDNVDVNFSEVYTRMHSAFDDSPIEKIKKTILSAIDAVKSKFN